MAEAQTGRLPKLGARLNQAAAQQTAGSGSAFRCQWCMVDLEPGVNVCPTCGSPGVDTKMVVPGAEVTINPDQVAVAPKPEAALEEWWNDDEEQVYRNTAATDQSQAPVFVGVFGTVVICIVAGIIAGPLVLADAFESSLGVTVENANDLRPLGGLLGFLLGAFIGAIALWVTAPRR